MSCCVFFALQAAACLCSLLKAGVGSARFHPHIEVDHKIPYEPLIGNPPGPKLEIVVKTALILG